MGNLRPTKWLSCLIIYVLRWERGDNKYGFSGIKIHLHSQGIKPETQKLSRKTFDKLESALECTFPSSEMEKNEDFFSFSGRSVSEGGTLLPRVDFTAPSVARAVMKTRGSKVPPEDTLLSEKEEKSEVFYISDVGWYFLSFYSTLPHCLSVLGCSLTIF